MGRRPKGAGPTHQVLPGKLDTYLRSISRYDLLSADQERDLAERIQKGDEQALQTLVCANLRFVVSVARVYQGQGVPVEDLINDGNIGLVRAARRFDGRKNFKFVSYAVWWIRQAILQGLANQSRTVRLPLNQVGFVVRVGKARERLEQRYRRVPNTDELSDLLEAPAEKVHNATQVAARPASLDAPANTLSDTPRREMLADTETDMPDTCAGNNHVSSLVHEVLDTVLTSRERKVVSRYYGIGTDAPYTLDEIGIQLSLTRERVRQLRQRALKKLKECGQADVMRMAMAE